jgi:uncharacterized protein YndB with AHSA1/START domain
MTMPAPEPRLTVEVKRLFPATREQVFRAWTEASALERWFKPMGSMTTVTQLDLRVGGTYRFDLTNPGVSDIVITGYYVEIVRPEKLVFTWQSSTTDDKETLVTVILLERAAFTEVRLTHERLTTEQMILGHQKGWEFFMDNFGTLFET